jgi:hypothetical protein
LQKFQFFAFGSGSREGLLKGKKGIVVRVSQQDAREGSIFLNYNKICKTIFNGLRKKTKSVSV